MSIKSLWQEYCNFCGGVFNRNSLDKDGHCYHCRRLDDKSMKETF